MRRANLIFGMPGSAITVAFIAVLSTVACSGPNVEATVEARLAQERAIEATVEARVKENADLLLYENGIYLGTSGDLLAGIDKLSEINSESYYYGNAQTMISDFEIQILERELEEAQKRAQQEAEVEKKRAEEENAALREAVRIETEAKTTTEREAEVQKKRAEEENAALREAVRIEAEAKATAEREAEVEKRRAEEENAALREAVRIEAEAKATAEQEAEAQKQQAEQEAEAQKQRAAKAAKEAEKRRIASLAKTNPMIQAVITKELRFYFAYLPYYIAPGVADAVEDIAEVLLDWRPYPDVSVKRVYSESDADLVVAWIRDYGSHTLGESIFKSHIKVGLGTTNCLGDWRAFDANTVKKILWHEIGHSMGYGHSSNPNNVMYSTTDTQFEVEQDIADIIGGGWSMTFPLCSSGNYRYFFESDDDYTGFNVYVLPPGVSGEEFEVGNGSYYTSCESVSMVRTWNTCNILLGASIFLKNITAYKALTFEGEITALDEPPWPDMTWDDSARQYRESDMDYYRSLFR